MKFIIDQEIFEKFPETTLGVIIAKNVDNSGEIKEIEEQLRKEENVIRSKYSSTETLSQTPKIDVWRKAYSNFGAKPKEHKSSIEALYRRIIKGENLRHISKLVDIYNLISIKYLLPAGGEDLKKVKGNIYLTFAKNNEPAVLLLGEKEPRQPQEGEVIYKDDISSICRRWNWREADRTKLTEETKNCILVVEGISSREEVKKATNELKILVEKHCKGKLILNILDKNNREIEH